MAGGTPLRTIGSTSTSAIVNSLQLVIGAVTLLPGDEYPPEIEFPSEMRMAVHDLIGGGRNVQPMGLVLDDVQWSGEIIGPNAEARMLLFERMEASGQVQKLKWLYRRLNVVVKQFRPKYLHANRVQYTIVLQVVSDAANRYFGTAAASVSSQTSALANNAGAQASNAVYPGDPGAADTAAAAANAAASNAVANPSSVAGGFSVANVAKYAGLAAQAAAIAQNRPTSLVGACYAAGALTAAVGMVLPNLPNPVGSSTGSASASSFLQDMTTTIGLASSYISAITPLVDVATPGFTTGVTSSTLVNASQLLFTLQLIRQNVANGQAPQSVLCQTGTSFEEVSARFYGDTSFAGQLKRANGGVSNVIRAGTVVQLYPFQQNTTVPSVRSSLAA
jgi:hypothetical protein